MSSGNIEFDEEAFEWEQKHESTLFIHHCIAGCLAGMTEHCLLLPFDNIKTHAQVLKAETNSEIKEIISILYKRGGIFNFWKGASVMASGCIPAHAAYFSIFETSKSYFIDKKDTSIHFYLFGLTGVLATVTHDLIITPFDVLKQRTQILKEPSLKILRETLKLEGPSAFFRSFPITMAMNIPWAAVLVGSNESLKLLTGSHTFMSYFCCASISASIASILTIPLDNIKTRLQTQTCKARDCGFKEDCSFGRVINPSKTFDKAKATLRNPFFFSKILKKFAVLRTNHSRLKDVRKSCHLLQKAEKIKYLDIKSTILTIAKEEGLKGFTKGVFPRILGQAPSAAVSWATYESIKNWLVKNRVCLH